MIFGIQVHIVYCSVHVLETQSKLLFGMASFLIIVNGHSKIPENEASEDWIMVARVEIPLWIIRRFWVDVPYHDCEERGFWSLRLSSQSIGSKTFAASQGIVRTPIEKESGNVRVRVCQVVYCIREVFANPAALFP